MIVTDRLADWRTNGQQLPDRHELVYLSFCESTTRTQDQIHSHTQSSYPEAITDPVNARSEFTTEPLMSSMMFHLRTGRIHRVLASTLSKGIFPSQAKPETLLGNFPCTLFVVIRFLFISLDRGSICHRPWYWSCGFWGRRCGPSNSRSVKSGKVLHRLRMSNYFLMKSWAEGEKEPGAALWEIYVLYQQWSGLIP